MRLEDVLDAYPDELFIKMDGFDNCIIGVDESSMRLIYSQKKIIKTLCKDMSEEEALEYYYYNIDGSYIDAKPIICSDLCN